MNEGNLLGPRSKNARDCDYLEETYAGSLKLHGIPRIGGIGGMEVRVLVLVVVKVRVSVAVRQPWSIESPHALHLFV